MSKNSAKNQQNMADSIVSMAVNGKWADTPVGDEEDALRWRPRVIEYNLWQCREQYFQINISH